MKRRIISILLILAILATSLLSVSCGNLSVRRPQPEQKQEQVSEKKEEQAPPEQKQEQPSEKKEDPVIDEKGSYTSKEDVALYLWTYRKLPSNFITKNEAQKLGWNGGGLDKYSKGKCIGGDKFGNREGILPKNHKYIECDIDTLGKKDRGAKRIVFADDCSLIYYTEDHYSTFELLYGEEK